MSVIYLIYVIIIIQSYIEIFFQPFMHARCLYQYTQIVFRYTCSGQNIDVLNRHNDRKIMSRQRKKILTLIQHDKYVQI